MPSSTILGSTDPYEYQHSVRASQVQMVVTARGEFEATLTRIDLHRLWMQRGWQWLLSIAHSADHKERNPIFCCADPAQAPIILGGIEVSAGEIVFSSPGAEHHYPGGSRRDRASTRRTRVDGPAVTRVLRPKPALMSRLLALHKAADDLAASAPDILAHPEVAKAIEQKLVRAMITCLTDHEAVESSRSRQQRGMIMRRFERVLEANRDEPLHVTEICATIGVTDRTLRLHCQEHPGWARTAICGCGG